jgi:hypothetical protein
VGALDRTTAGRLIYDRASNTEGPAMKFEKTLLMGAEEMVPRLKELLRMAEAGEVHCYAARLF